MAPTSNINLGSLDSPRGGFKRPKSVWNEMKMEGFEVRCPPASFILQLVSSPAALDCPPSSYLLTTSPGPSTDIQLRKYLDRVETFCDSRLAPFLKSTPISANSHAADKPLQSAVMQPIFLACQLPYTCLSYANARLETSLQSQGAPQPCYNKTQKSLRPSSLEPLPHSQSMLPNYEY